MANYQFSADILQDALFRAGEPTDGTSDFHARAKAYMNRAYFGLCMGGSELVPTIHEDWWWLRKSPPGTLTLEPKITAGTVYVTNNSTSVKLSAAQSKSLATWFLKTDAHDDVFRISTHVSGSTGLTLGSVYTGSTATAAAYKAVKLQYDLATGVLRVISPMRTFRSDRDYEIHGMDAHAMDRRWPLALVEEGVPDAFAHADENTVRFNRYGGASATKLIRAEYDYLVLPTPLTTGATEEPLVPWQWRRVLADWVTFWTMIDKSDDRADGAGLAARNGVTAMAAENRHKLAAFGRGFGQIRPRQEDLTRFDRPVRTSAGLIIG